MITSIKAEVHSTGHVSVDMPNNSTKNIRLKDYIGVLNNILGEQDSPEEGSSAVSLPYNTHSIDVGPTKTVLCMYSKETTRTIRYSGWTKPQEIAAPNVLVRIELIPVNGETGKYALGNINWYTSDLPRESLPAEFPSRPDPSKRIWPLPLPNIYDSGTMCTGSNGLPSVLFNDWSILNSLIEDTLWGSIFNSDLAIRGLSRSSSVDSWLRILSSKDTLDNGFPYDKLSGF